MKDVLSGFSIVSFQGSHWDWKNGKAFFQLGKRLENFEQTGKVLENHTKYWKMRKFQMNTI